MNDRWVMLFLTFSSDCCLEQQLMPVAHPLHVELSVADMWTKKGESGSITENLSNEFVIMR